MKLLHPGDEVTVQRRDSRDDWRGEVVRWDVYEGEARDPALVVLVPGGEKEWFDPVTGAGSNGWQLAAKHLPAKVVMG